MLLRSVRWVLFFSILGILLFGGSPSLAQQEQRYLYDPLGRLIGEVNPQGETVFYDYDAVGNLLAIRRQAISGQVGITFVNPSAGTVGTRVELFGAGFSLVPSENQIDFNGVSAPVLSVSPNSVTTTVPVGATSGPITVVTPLGTAVSPQPFTVLGTITLSSSVNLIAVGRSALIGVTLDRPAPPGGITVTLTSEVPAILQVSSPGAVFIPEGENTGQITVNGISQGNVLLRGKASGYLDGTLIVAVSLKVISLPATLNVPLGQTTALPVTIAPNAAPPGGVVVTLTSSDPSRVELLTPTVTIPAGQLSANATVRGTGIGTATIRAVHPEYSEAASQVTTRAALNILNPSVILNASFPTNITIQLESAGQAIAAPPPGVTVTLTAANPGCLSVPSSVTIPAGLVNTTVVLRHGGTPSLPCNTSVTVSAPDITQDSVAVRVDPVPAVTFNVSTYTVGAGLQSSCPFGCVMFLGASNHGGVTVHLESSDPTKILLSPDGTTPGAATLDLAIPNGQAAATFVVQGVETATPLPSTVAITASAPGFTNGTSTATIVQPAFDLVGLPATTTSLSANTGFYVQIGIPNTNNTGFNELQAVRAGGVSKTVTFTNSNAAVAQLLTTGTTGQSATVQIQPGQSNSPTSVTTGGVAFDPLVAGSTTVSAGIPGLIPLPGAAKNVTVTAPAVTFNVSTYTVGAGLQSSCPFGCVMFLGASNHGGVTVHLESSDPTKILLSPDGTTPGAATLDLAIPNGQAAATFVVQGVETATPLPSTVAITASAPGFTNGTSTATIVQPAFDLVGLPATTTSLSANTGFYVQIGIPNTNNTGFNELQAVRAGGVSKTVTFTNSNAAVAQLLTTGTTGQSATVQIQPGQSNSPTSVTTGGVAFDPLVAGSTTVSAGIPGLIPLPGAAKNVTVTP